MCRQLRTLVSERWLRVGAVALHPLPSLSLYGCIFLMDSLFVIPQTLIPLSTSAREEERRWAEPARAPPSGWMHKHAHPTYTHSPGFRMSPGGSTDLGF